ncbi:MAG: AAA family ATPase [Fibrobacterota bacterium]
MAWIERQLKSALIRRAKTLPVILLTGPRQSGKTSLARKTFPKLPYVSLESPEERALATGDAKGFLARYPKGAILDEIQRAPELPSYIQGIVDEPGFKGLFVLTGSNQFAITHRITQSLAGRTALLQLLPFTLHELGKTRKPPGLRKTRAHRVLSPHPCG